VNTTISEADDKPEHIAEILRHWWKKRQQAIDTLTNPADDDGDGATRHPSAPAGRRSGRGLIQTRMTARGVFETRGDDDATVETGSGQR
jgi:hypothetical protein